VFAGIGVDERPLHPACERLLIPHGGGQIVTILRNDLLVDRAPTPDDIDSVDTTLQVQQREQLSDGGDIVGFRLLGHLPEHHQTDAGPVAEQMQRPKPYYKSRRSPSHEFSNNANYRARERSNLRFPTDTPSGDKQARGFCDYAHAANKRTS